MTTLIFGVGVGTFILVIVWTFALLLCCISLRTQRNIGPIAVSVALLVMLVLLLLPRGPQSEVTSVYKVYDYLFLWRIVLVILLALSAVAGGVFLLIEHVMAPKHARKMKAIARGVRTASIVNKSFNIADSDDFVNNVMNSSVPVIVNFHAEWCEPCHILTPKLQELIGSRSDINLAIVDVEKNAELVHTFEVKAVPAVIAVRNGLVVDKFIGLVDGDMIDNLINKLAPMKAADPIKPN